MYDLIQQKVYERNVFVFLLVLVSIEKNHETCTRDILWKHVELRQKYLTASRILNSFWDHTTPGKYENTTSYRFF